MSKLFNRLYWAKQNMMFRLRPSAINQDVPEIEDMGITTSKHIGHVAMYTTGNAGDTLLPRTVRDIVDGVASNHWKGIHAHRLVNRTMLNEINELDGLLIGGGGLFLRDTNPNNLSGWQWSCSIKSLKKIDVPVALFAVGYNRFRGQKDFKPVFKRHLEVLAEKSVYLGLRNSGSINAIKTYLPESLHDKVRYQPCPTTLCRQLYPEICNTELEEKTIALNCAFDRIDLRLGNRKEDILTQLASVAKTLSEHASIEYFSHTKSDENFLPYLDKAGVPYTLRTLYYIPPRKVVEAYSQVSLVIGMRGHAQMIPFGCGTPIISLISHDKMRWFLDDILRPKWGVEMNNPDFKEALLSSAIKALDEEETLRSDIDTIQQGLLEITHRNVTDFIETLK